MNRRQRQAVSLEVPPDQLPFLPESASTSVSAADADLSSADSDGAELNRAGPTAPSDGPLIELDELNVVSPLSDDSLDPPPPYFAVSRAYPSLPPPSPMPQSPSPPPSPPMYAAPIGPLFGQNNHCFSNRSIQEAPGTEPRDRFRRSHRRTPPIANEREATGLQAIADREMAIFNPGTNVLHFYEPGDVVVPDLPSYTNRIRDERAVAEENFYRYGRLLRCHPWTSDLPIDRELLPFVEVSVLQERRRQEIAMRSRLGPLPPRFYLHEFTVEQAGGTRIGQIWVPVGEEPPTTYEGICELERDLPEGALWEARFPEYLFFEDYLFNLPPLGTSPWDEDPPQRLHRCADFDVIHASPGAEPPLWLREAPPLPITARLFATVSPPAGLLAAAGQAGDETCRPADSSDLVVEPPTDPVARSPEDEVVDEGGSGHSATIPRRSRRPRPRRLDLARSLAELPVRVEDEVTSDITSEPSSEDTEVASIMTQRSSSFAGSTSSSGFRPILNRVQTMRNLINR